MGRGRKQRHKGGWSRKLKEVRSEQYREPGYDRYDGLEPYDPQDYKVVISLPLGVDYERLYATGLVITKKFVTDEASKAILEHLLDKSRETLEGYRRNWIDTINQQMDKSFKEKVS